jgi:RHS repeat-associated protein
VVTNALGGVVETIDYYPYGAARVTTGAYRAPRSFIGEFVDTETSLSYLNARYYTSGRGQFLSQDPVFGEVGQTRDGVAVLQNPQAQNSYSYAGNNPIVQKDPSGRILQYFLMLFTPSVAYSPDVGEEDYTSPMESAMFVAGVVSPGGKANEAVSLVRGTSFGKLGTIVDQEISKVAGYTTHGLAQKINRSIPTSEIVNTVRNPDVVLKQAGGNFVNVTEKTAVVVNSAGKVVTTYAEKQYNAVLKSIQNLINALKKQVKGLAKEKTQSKPKK